MKSRTKEYGQKKTVKIFHSWTKASVMSDFGKVLNPHCCFFLIWLQFGQSWPSYLIDRDKGGIDLSVNNQVEKGWIISVLCMHLPY